MCKYRKQLLKGELDRAVKTCFSELDKQSKFSIDITESDKDRIHLLITYSRDISLTSISEGWNRNLLMNYGITIQVFLLNISGKNTLSGMMDILCVLLEMQILILYANILKARVSGIHPIDWRSMVFCQKLYKRLCLLF